MSCQALDAPQLPVREDESLRCPRHAVKQKYPSMSGELCPNFIWILKRGLTRYGRRAMQHATMIGMDEMTVRGTKQ